MRKPNCNTIAVLFGRHVVTKCSPGRVTRIIKGYERGHYKRTVITRTDSGKLKIKSDDGLAATVSSEMVEKVSDGIAQ